MVYTEVEHARSAQRKHLSPDLYPEFPIRISHKARFESLPQFLAFHPDLREALPDMLRFLAQELTALGQNPDVRVLVFREFRRISNNKLRLKIPDAVTLEQLEEIRRKFFSQFVDCLPQPPKWEVFITWGGMIE